MENNLSHSVHRHTIVVTFTIILGFLLLALGEFYLYRNQMKLNRMVSEGLMQIKESRRNEEIGPTFNLPVVKPSIKPLKLE
jgi:hypothetical protein